MEGDRQINLLELLNNFRRARREEERDDGLRESQEGKMVILCEPFLPKEAKKGCDFLSSNRYLFPLILSHLDAKSLCRVSQCCKYFKTVADGDKLWKPLYFKDHNLPSLVPNFSSWAFRRESKVTLLKEVDNLKLLEECGGEKEGEVLDVLDQNKKTQFYEYHERVVAKLIPEGYRWKYMYQKATSYKFIALAYVASQPFDLILVPAGTYNCNEWNNHCFSQYGGLILLLYFLFFPFQLL